MRFLRKTAEYLFYFFVFLLPWQTKIILRPAATNFNEIDLYLSHLVLLAAIIISLVYKIRKNNETERISGTWWSLAGLELCILVSFFFAPDQILSFYHYILFLLGVGLFYLLHEGAAESCFEETCLDKTVTIYTFFASVFLQAILGIYQFLMQKTVVCKYLGLAAHNPAAAGTAVIETMSGRWLRAYGGLDHPNIFGGVLAISLIFAAYFLVKKKIIRNFLELGESIALFIFYFVALFALFFTFSRAAWLALAVGFLILFISLALQKDRWIIGRFLALVFFSGVMILMVACPYKELLHVRTAMDTRLEQKSVSERQEYLVESVGVIKGNWLFGVGTGNYPLALQQQDQLKKEVWDYQPVHNVFLLLWAESGILALILFFSFLVYIKKDHRELFSAAVISSLLVLMLLDHWLLSLPFGVLFLFFVLGLV